MDRPLTYGSLAKKLFTRRLIKSLTLSEMIKIIFAVYPDMPQNWSAYPNINYFEQRHEGLKMASATETCF